MNNAGLFKRFERIKRLFEVEVLRHQGEGKIEGSDALRVGRCVELGAFNTSPDELSIVSPEDSKMEKREWRKAEWKWEFGERTRSVSQI